MAPRPLPQRAAKVAAQQAIEAELQAEADAEAQKREGANEGQAVDFNDSKDPDFSADSDDDKGSREKGPVKDLGGDYEMGDDGDKSKVVEDSLLSPAKAADTIRRLMDRVEHLESDIASRAVGSLSLRDGPKPRLRIP